MRKSTISKNPVLISLLLLLNNYFLYAQAPGQSETAVTLNATVSGETVPLNRTLPLTIEIRWTGDIDLIKIGEIEEPVLSNFTIIGSRAANRIMDSQTGRTSVKEIVLTLQPVTLGMAYIEPVTMTYTDITTGKTHSMRTQRFPVRVGSAIAEPGQKGPLWPWVVFPLLAGMFGLIIFLIKKRQNQSGEPPLPDVILEESFLNDLKSNISLKTPDRNKAIGSLTRLFRRYLAEKYQIPAREATTDQLLVELNTLNLEVSIIDRCEKLFRNSDVTRFSGRQATPAELSEAYTTVESILESNLLAVKEAMEQEDGANKKRPSLGNILKPKKS